MLSSQVEMSRREEVLDEGARWRAVLARDAGFDGEFVFAVSSTGIYCRPSCPARRPRREQVRFFVTPDAAEQAGFRSCRRCDPRRASGDARAEWVRRVCAAIEARLEGPVTLAVIAEDVGTSPYHLQRTFKRLMGLTPREYADARRLATFKARLQQGQAVTPALYEAGYGASSRLYERASAQLGMTPATYRRGGRGMRIDYTIVDSPLGRLLVGATERGVSAVCLGESDGPLEAALRSEYPAAEIRREDGALARWVSAILRHIEGRQPRLDVPVDIQATAFQRRVWEALRSIPYGETRSYTEIARALGRPRAVRAVARACATNPVAIVVPCHRVVARDGDLAGYRWGVERKRALLERERRAGR